MKRFVTFAAVAALLVVPSAVLANVAVGGFESNTDSALPGAKFVNGGVPANYSVLVTSMTNPFVGDFGGDVTSSVYRDPGTGYLAFEYSFTVTSAVSPLRSATIGGDWRTTTVFSVGSDGSGSSVGDWTDGDPAVIGRLPVSGFGSPSVVWSSLFFPDGTSFVSGTWSAKFWYATDALTYSVVDFDALDGGLSAEAPVFAVPAPGAVLLGMIGLGGLGWIRRRFA